MANWQKEMGKKRFLALTLVRVRNDWRKGEMESEWEKVKVKVVNVMKEVMFYCPKLKQIGVAAHNCFKSGGGDDDEGSD